MNLKKINVFLQRNFELVHITMVMDLICFEKLGSGVYIGKLLLI